MGHDSNRRKHVSPDVLVTKGIEPRQRDNYLLWKEGKAPDVVIEVTSKTTKDEDREKKFAIYRGVKVKEYFLFDPRSEYLSPPLQGFRLVRGRYAEIRPVAGRLPSKELGLCLEKRGKALHFIHPETGERLLTPREVLDLERKRADAAEERAEAEKQRAFAAEQRAFGAEHEVEAEKARSAAEIARLRRELEGHLRRKKDAR